VELTPSAERRSLLLAFEPAATHVPTDLAESPNKFAGPFPPIFVSPGDARRIRLYSCLTPFPQCTSPEC
jgi:hypothetical protein